MHAVEIRLLKRVVSSHSNLLPYYTVNYVQGILSAT